MTRTGFVIIMTMDKFDSNSVPIAGEELKSIRENLGLSLEDVSNDLHIRVAYLQALEDNDLEKIPSLVQAKGFLRLYTNYLHLDLTALAQSRMSVTEADSKPSPPQSTEEAEQNSSDLDEYSFQKSDITEIKLDQRCTPHETIAEPETDNPSQPRQTASSQELFEELGQAFRHQREMLQLSLSDVESYIHIRQHYLSAIESAEFDRMPSSVQARGMIKNYANFLNLDEDQMLETFADALQAQHRETQSITHDAQQNNHRKHQPAKRSGEWRKFVTADLLIGSGLVIVVFIIAVLSVAKVLNTNQSLRTPTTTVLAMRQNTSTLSPTPSPTATATPENVVLELPAADAVQDEDVIISPQDVESTSNLQLYLVANQRAYLRIITDNEAAFEGRVHPGTAYQFFADESIDLLTGNAAAFKLTFIQNGTETKYDTLGLNGQVLNISFRPDGIITPTPTATLTPTVTNTPSFTQTPTETEQMEITPTISQ